MYTVKKNNDILLHWTQGYYQNGGCDGTGYENNTRNCIPCQTCELGDYANHACSGTSQTDVVCQPCEKCETGEYIKSQCPLHNTNSTNRECEKCKECGSYTLPESIPQCTLTASIISNLLASQKQANIKMDVTALDMIKIIVHVWIA